METGFLNFRDEEHFSDFSLPLHQYDLLDVTPETLTHMNSDLDYLPLNSRSTNTTDGLWETEQELNGDMAILPASGVASVIPKIESIKEDFVKVLTDWQEHIGYLQASDTEEDINMVALNMNNLPEKINMNSADDNFQGISSMSPVKIAQKIVNNTKNVAIENLETDHDKDDCIDVETVSEHQPVLEAGDVKSLLEQFEASEANLGLSINTKAKKVVKKTNKCKKENEAQTVLKKSIESQASKLHKNIRDSLPKEVIDRIRASGRKKPISVIPALSRTKNINKNNGMRMQEAAATLSRNKLLKIVTTTTSSNVRADNSVQLDHDYCSSSSGINSSSSSSCSTSRGKISGKNGVRRHTVTKGNDQGKSTLRKDVMKRSNSWGDSNSKKDSGLESGEVSDSSEDPAVMTVVEPSSSKNLVPRVCLKPDEKEVKVRSALATSILQLKNGVLTKTKSVDGGPHIGKPMISVLKKPPIFSTPLSNNLNHNESIITTKNSSNNEVQNIIVQDIPTTPICESEKKPPRRKLNLAEYRSRREQTRSDNSRNSSPIQPMVLVYIHHVSTTTEPIKDDPENPVWSEREIVSVLKPKNEVEEQNDRPKPPTTEVGVQTYETILSNPAATIVHEEHEVKNRISRLNRKNTSYRQRRTLSNSSRSRSKSRSRSRSGSRSKSRSSSRGRRNRSERRGRSRSYSRSRRKRSRSKNRSRNTSYSRSRSRSRSSRSHSRSLSRRRNIRQRKISHRRSSVSSSSSWSSRSRSRSRSTYRSRSRSRSSESQSSRYSNYSRFLRKKSDRYWKKDTPRRRNHKYSQNSLRSDHYNDHSRRSSSYRRPYFTQEKKRQVEERRVIYVGGLDERISKNELKRRFEMFGPVLDISLHFRDHGDNYGFVTFAYRTDAYQAVEHGNDDPSLPRYDLCFGGRRAFCKVKYADLDDSATDSYENSRSLLTPKNENNSFDLLLKEAKAKLRNRKV